MRYAMAFLGGIAGSMHCLGMCGAFPLALAGRRGKRVAPQVLYNLGRVNALVFIGACSGALGAVLVGLGPVAAVESALSLAAGLLMVAIGLEMLGVASLVSGRAVAIYQATVGRALRGVVAAPSAAAPLALGIFNAFLPCPLIYGFAAQAAATASPAQGALTMLAFGSGTVPTMLALGVLGGRLAPETRSWATRVVAGLIVVYGVVLVARAFLDPASHRH